MPGAKTLTNNAMKVLCSLLSVVCCLVGHCNSVTSLVVDASRTPMPTDSLAYSDSVNHATCSLIVDFPSATDSFSVAVASYIADELRRVCLNDSQEEDITAQSPAYTGPIADGKALLSFYGKINMASLQKDVADISAEFLTYEGIAYDYEAGVRKTADNDKYVSYTTSSYVFLGGAHGSSFARTVNIAKPSGKVLENTVDTTMTLAMQPLLRRGVLSYFHEMGDTSITDKTLNENLLLEDDIIPLPAYGPFLTDKGLTFVYQQYEICCYAMGMVQFVVPYAEAKPFMTTEAWALVE